MLDFGFAELKPKEPQRGVPKGSFLWMAPEVMMRQPYNHKCAAGPRAFAQR